MENALWTVVTYVLRSVTGFVNQMGEVNMKLSIRKVPNLGRALRSRSGQSLIEFALVAPLFFLLVFGITDFGRLFFTQETLEFALREAGRFAVTGQHLPDAKNGGNLTRVASIKAIAQQKAVGIDVNNIVVSSGGVNDFAGRPGDTVVVKLKTDLKLITPMIGRFFGPSQTYTFTVQTTFRNEPFDFSQTI
jgi:Flp pilus assembly protein TadG